MTTDAFLVNVGSLSLKIVAANLCKVAVWNISEELVLNVYLTTDLKEEYVLSKAA